MPLFHVGNDHEDALIDEESRLVSPLNQQLSWTDSKRFGWAYMQANCIQQVNGTIHVSHIHLTLLRIFACDLLHFQDMSYLFTCNYFLRRRLLEGSYPFSILVISLLPTSQFVMSAEVIFNMEDIKNDDRYLTQI